MKSSRVMENFINGLKDNIDALEAVDLKYDTILESIEDWDSLAILSVMAFVASEYGVNMTAKEITDAGTPEKIFNLVQSKK